MTAAWMLYLLGVGTLLAFGAGLLASALRHFGQSVRFVHAAALASTLVLAVVAPRRKIVDSMTFKAAVTVAAPEASVVREPTILDRVRAARGAVGDAMSAASDAVRRRMPPNSTRVAVGVWASMSIALLVLFISVNRRLSVTRRSCEMRTVDGTPVRVTPNVGPAVIGFVRAEIVVPPWLLERPAAERRLILAHEREHLRARDHLLLGGAWLATIALPWHPAVWYLLSRIRLAIELDCDVRVLRGGASPRSYGALLIDMATRQSAMGIGALALADTPSQLERRIRAMHWRRGRLGVTRGLVLGAIGGLIVLAACEAKVPTAAEVASMDVGALEKKAGNLDGVDGKFTKADYFVNGAPVSADSARAIVAAKISSVGVMKARSAGGRDTILITTVDRMPKRQRTEGDDDLVPLSMGGLSSSATLMIDGVVQAPGVRVRQDPKEIVSIQVMKPGKDPKYPNGLIAIERKRAKRVDAGQEKTSGSAPLADSAGITSGMLYPTLVRDGARTQLANSRDATGAPVLVATFDAKKPFAITIDGVRATMSELEALEPSEIRSQMMYPGDARARSSDPAAANGLMQVRTKRAVTQ